MKKLLYPALVLSLALVAAACSDDDDPAAPTLTITDQTIEIDENPATGAVIGTMPSLTGVTYSLVSADPAGAVAVSAAGEITVVERIAFDYETRTSVTVTVEGTDGEATAQAEVVFSLTDVPSRFWDSAPLTFTKAGGADWTLEANQDRITSEVWITRQSQYSIYNIWAGDFDVEDATTSDLWPNGNSDQPFGTLWAEGSIADGVESLTFAPLLTTIPSQLGNNIVENPLVMFIPSEDLYIDVYVTAWGNNQGGASFTYDRGTAEEGDPVIPTPL